MSSLHMHTYLHELLQKEIQTIMRVDCSHDFPSTLMKSLWANNVLLTLKRQRKWICRPGFEGYTQLLRFSLDLLKQSFLNSQALRSHLLSSSKYRIKSKMYYSSHYKETNTPNPPGNALKIYSFMPLYLNNDIYQNLQWLHLRPFHSL